MNFKKISASFLAGVLALSACACSAVSTSGTSVSATSSAADSYAKWLTDRLGEVDDSVVLGVGNDAAYGIDMSDFENDGYIIRNLGDETLIFGKTADGLDRAVRKYAKTVEAGTDIENVTFHEGHRIEKLVLFGVDISEFTVVYPDENNANMRFAAEELVRLVNIATGVTLPVTVGTSDSAHKIEFRFSDDTSLRSDGYKYYEDSCPPPYL